MPNLREIEAQAKALAPIFSQVLEKAKSDLRQEFLKEITGRDQRIAELEKALALNVWDESTVVESVLKAIPTPKDGEDGVDGKDADPDLIRQMVEQAVADLPPPTPGEPGPQGEPGEPGKAAAPEEIAALFERRFSDLVISWERQARDSFEKAIDRMPLPQNGKDGRDGVSVDALEIALGEDGRTLQFKFECGNQIIEKCILMPVVLDRGQHRAENQYMKGDGVSYAGSFWIAQVDSPAEKPGIDKSWRLAVKKGRDGK